MLQLFIIADDFTGALDTGIQFQKRGIRTQVLTRTWTQDDEIHPDTEVLVVDAETRPMSPEDAYRTVRDLTSHARANGVPIIYKKTDSALRGNIGAELTAVADACGDGDVYFLPAHPTVNRITRDGIHYIDGELLEHSVFGQDPFEPVRDSYIPDIIGRQSAIPTEVIRHSQDLTDYTGVTSRIIICDAQCTEDIDRRLDEIIGSGNLHYLAGCAGLADRLVDKLDLHRAETIEPHKTAGMYVACGSLNRITENQVHYAQEHGGFHVVHLTMEQKLTPAYYDTDAGDAFLNEIADLCDHHKRVIVDSYDQDDSKEQFLKEHQIPNEAVRFRISEAHGRIVNRLIEQGKDLTILMTGGDTLMGYMNQIGCHEIEPICEIEQGVVAARIWRNGHQVQLLSKSGGLGTEDILCRIADKVIK